MPSSANGWATTTIVSVHATTGVQKLTNAGYISSWDGKVSKLVVQAIDDIYDEQLTSTYRRTYVRNISPMFLRLANWPFNHVNPDINDGKPTSEGTTSCRSRCANANTPTDMPMLCVKWFFASIVMALVVCRSKYVCRIAT